MLYQRHLGGKWSTDSECRVTTYGQGDRVLGLDRLPRSGHRISRLYHSLLRHPHPQDEGEAKRGANYSKADHQRKAISINLLELNHSLIT